MTSNPTWPDEVVERVARAIDPAAFIEPVHQVRMTLARDAAIAALDASPLGEVVEALEAIKEFADQDETQLVWETANTALKVLGQ